MKAILLLLLLLCNTVLYAQECDCRKKFDSVHVYLSKNYVGFIDKVTPATQHAYTSMLAKLRLQAASVKGATHCMLLIDRYLRYFKDHHLSLVINYVPVTENIQLSPAQLDLLEKQPAAALTGIYEMDTVYKVALVRSSHGIRSYAAVVIQSASPAWKPGEVKFELASTGHGRFDVIRYLDNRRIRFDTLSFTKQWNGLTALGWQKEGSPGMPQTAAVAEDTASFYFRQLNDSTGYLRIGSFDAAYYPVADSVLNANDAYLRKNTQLIIDVRDNGAGTNKLIERLRPLMYTQPVKIIGADFYATPDNISAWGRILDEQAGQLPSEYVEQIRKVIQEGDGLQGRLVSMGPDENMILPSPLPAPAKIGVLINGQCSNTAEQFLLEAAQSKKVKLFGTATQGALDYSQVNEVKFTAPDFSVDYPVTRSRRIMAGQGIDDKGIQPAVKIDFHKAGWLEEILKQL